MFVQQFYGNRHCETGASQLHWSDYGSNDPSNWECHQSMVDINNININIDLVTIQLFRQSASTFNKGKSSIIFWELSQLEVEDIMPSCWSLIHHYKPNFDNHIHERNHQYLWKNTRCLLFGENNAGARYEHCIGTVHFVSHNNQSGNAIKKHILSLTSIK